MNKKVAFEILGLQSNAHPTEIKEAYLKLSKKYHPDVCVEKDSEELFKKINEAYSSLKDQIQVEEQFSSRINRKANYNTDEFTHDDLEIIKKNKHKKSEREKDIFNQIHDPLLHSKSTQNLRRESVVAEASNKEFIEKNTEKTVGSAKLFNDEDDEGINSRKKGRGSDLNHLKNRMNSFMKKQ